ncbi:hypothetical protein [Geodermatophilus tzadiensis]|uniref:hypothetical protein n=1 Tax=Geodermatophilus tzadiensis TaxID=1137988 RepID=UPI000D06EE9C|nr:hypothetical protein [Geodermatophilus tzadiensis]
MILAAGLLVLAGLGLFVAGVQTGVAGWYWACVAACGLAVVLLAVARLRAPAAAAAPAPVPPAPPTAPGGPPPGEAATADRGTGHPVTTPASTGAADASGDPAEEDVEVTDLLIVVDLTDEVLVVDEHPRYHLAGCRWLGGRETIPLPVGEARAEGFTPCGVCTPDRHLARVARARKSAGRG